MLFLGEGRVGVSRERLFLFLRKQHLLFSVPPTFTTRPSNKTVVEGATVTLVCEATGNPSPNITWTKDGKTVANGDKLSFETNRTLSGKYWCTAENGLTPTVNASANIDVQCKYWLHSCMETCSS